MSESPWSHLPNAKVIDAVVADGESRPEVWEATYDKMRGAFDYATLAAAWTAASEADVDAGTLEDLAMVVSAGDGTRGAVWDVVTDAVYALIAWDSSADLLALTPDALRTIIDTCDGDVKHQAVLLLPAVIARSTI